MCVLCSFFKRFNRKDRLDQGAFCFYAILLLIPIDFVDKSIVECGTKTSSTTRTTRDDLCGQMEYVPVNILPTLKEQPLSVIPGTPECVTRYIRLKHCRRRLQALYKV